MIKNNKQIYWPYLIAAYSSLFLLGFIDNSRGLAYPLILKYFNISTVSGSYIFTMASLTSLFSVIFSKFWLNKFGTFNGLLIFLIFFSIGAILTGVSGILLNYKLLMVASLFLGLGLGGIAVAINLMVGEATPLEYSRQAFSGLHALYGVASLFAPFLLNKFINLGYTWGLFFIIAGVVPIIVMYYIVINTSLEHHDDTSKSQNAPYIIKISCGVLLAFYVSAELLVSTRIALYIQTYKQLPQSTSANHLMLFFFFLTVGRLLFSFLRVRGKTYSWLVISLMSSIVCFLLGLYFHYYFLALSGLGMSIFFPCTLSWISEEFPKFYQEIIPFSLGMVGAFLIVMHSVAGWITQSYGIKQTFTIVPIALLISLFTLLASKFFAIKFNKE